MSNALLPVPTPEGGSPSDSATATQPPVAGKLGRRLMSPWIGVTLFLNELAAHGVLAIGVHLFLVSVRWGGNAIAGSHRVMLWDAFPADWLLDGADFVVILTVLGLAIWSSARAYIEWRTTELS